MMNEKRLFSKLWTAYVKRRREVASVLLRYNEKKKRSWKGCVRSKREEVQNSKLQLLKYRKRERDRMPRHDAMDGGRRDD